MPNPGQNTDFSKVGCGSNPPGRSLTTLSGTFFGDKTTIPAVSFKWFFHSFSFIKQKGGVFFRSFPCLDPRNPRRLKRQRSFSLPSWGNCRQRSERQVIPFLHNMQSHTLSCSTQNGSLGQHFRRREEPSGRSCRICSFSRK